MFNIYIESQYWFSDIFSKIVVLVSGQLRKVLSIYLHFAKYLLSVSLSQNCWKEVACSKLFSLLPKLRNRSSCPICRIPIATFCFVWINFRKIVRVYENAFSQKLLQAKEKAFHHFIHRVIWQLFTLILINNGINNIFMIF